MRKQDAFDMRIRQALDARFSGVTGQLMDAEHILRLAKGKEKPVKRKLSAAFILVMVFMLAAVGALAAVIATAGTVSWDGQFSPSPVNEPVSPSPVPSGNVVPNNRVVDELLADIPESEFWCVSYVNGSNGRYGCIGPHLSTLSELSQHINGMQLQVPTLSANYTLENIELYYDCSPLVFPNAYEVVPYGSMTLSKYKVAPATDRDIEGYSVSLLDSYGRSVMIEAFSIERSTYEEPVNGDFRGNEGDHYLVLEAAGFDRGIAIRREDGSQMIQLQQDIDEAWLASYSIYAPFEVNINELFSKE